MDQEDKALGIEVEQLLNKKGLQNSINYENKTYKTNAEKIKEIEKHMRATL